MLCIADEVLWSMTPTFASTAFGFGLALSVFACSGGGSSGDQTSSSEDGGAGAGSSSGGRSGSDTADSGGTGTPALDAGPGAQSSDGGHVTVSEGGAATEGGASADAGPAKAHLAIPMYVDPTDSPSLWSQVYAAGSAAGLLVMNPNNGPDPSVDSEYTTAIASAHAAGQRVIGYVHSVSATRAIGDVEADVDTYYAQYTGIDGIFVDEVSDDASTVASYYAPLYAHIKAKAANVTVVINPGTMVDESFMTATDILLSYEDTYADYIDANQNPPTPAWVKTYPASRFWNIVHTTPAGSEADAIARARAANVGWIYVTAEGPDTAYQDIETGAYWTSEIALVTGP